MKVEIKFYIKTLLKSYITIDCQVLNFIFFATKDSKIIKNIVYVKIGLKTFFIFHLYWWIYLKIHLEKQMFTNSFQIGRLVGRSPIHEYVVIIKLHFMLIVSISVFLIFYVININNRPLYFCVCKIVYE